MTLPIGDIVGSYRVLGVLGSGGMGHVYKVEHTITRRLEAMKVLLEAGPGAEEAAERFLREIRVQAALDHPNIAAVYNAFWAEDRLLMVMEFVEGDSLRALLHRGSLTLADGIVYARQALAALSYAHAQGVTHRDITPSNLMVTPQGVLKVTDFGLAKGPSDPRLTRSGAMLGSPLYMSPEQVRASPALDARADLYSLGAVLYELATGSKPFDLGDTFSIMVAQVEQSPRPPIEIQPGLPAALNEIILTALAKDPAQRFQSADEFSRALETVGQPVGRAGRISRLRRLAPGFAAVALAAVLVGSRGHTSVSSTTTTPAAPIVVARGALLLPAGTTLQVRTTLPLSSTTHRPGQTFLARLAEPLVAEGRVVAAPGSGVDGVIVDADRGSRFGGRARLVVSLVRLRTADGRVVRIYTDPVGISGGARAILVRRGGPAVITGDTLLRFHLRRAASGL